MCGWWKVKRKSAGVDRSITRSLFLRMLPLKQYDTDYGSIYPVQPLGSCFLCNIHVPRQIPHSQVLTATTLKHVMRVSVLIYTCERESCYNQGVHEPGERGRESLVTCKGSMSLLSVARGDSYFASPSI
jgi:hypothetical protein